MTAALFPDVDPWEQPVNGAELLEEIAAHLRRYVALPEHAPEALAVWTVATWLLDTVEIAPLLVLSSPTKRSGKTLMLDLIRPLVYRGYLTSGVGVTAAVIFRLNEQEHPTLLIDEAEKLASDDQSRELIGLLNSGYRRGGRAMRCAERSHALQHFDSYGFRAVAVIGRLWDTLMDRALLVPMARKPQGEKVDRFVRRSADEEGAALARRIARWVQDHRSAVEMVSVVTPRPDWLHDRACDNWGPLFAVGMAAGGGWIGRLKEAARALSGGAADDGDRRELLLRDVQSVFEEQGRPAFLSTAELLKALVAVDDSPWGDLNGRELTKQRLAAWLRPFGIKPMLRRDGYTVERGYELAAFSDAFARYIPPAPPSESLQSLQIDDKPEKSESLQPKTVTEIVTGNSAAMSGTSGSRNGCNGSNRGDGVSDDFPTLNAAVDKALELFPGSTVVHHDPA